MCGHRGHSRPTRLGGHRGSLPGGVADGRRSVDVSESWGQACANPFGGGDSLRARPTIRSHRTPLRHHGAEPPGTCCSVLRRRCRSSAGPTIRVSARVSEMPERRERVMAQRLSGAGRAASAVRRSRRRCRAPGPAGSLRGSPWPPESAGACGAEGGWCRRRRPVQARGLRSCESLLEVPTVRVPWAPATGRQGRRVARTLGKPPAR